MSPQIEGCSNVPFGDTPKGHSSRFDCGEFQECNTQAGCPDNLRCVFRSEKHGNKVPVVVVYHCVSQPLASKCFEQIYCRFFCGGVQIPSELGWKARATLPFNPPSDKKTN